MQHALEYLRNAIGDSCALVVLAVASAIFRLRRLGAEAVLVASNAPTITVLKDTKQIVDGPLFGVTPPVLHAITVLKTKFPGERRYQGSLTETLPAICARREINVGGGGICCWLSCARPSAENCR